MESLHKPSLAIRIFSNDIQSCVGSSERPQHPRDLGNRGSLLNCLRVSLDANILRLCKKFNKSNFIALVAIYI